MTAKQDNTEQVAEMTKRWSPTSFLQVRIPACYRGPLPLASCLPSGSLPVAEHTAKVMISIRNAYAFDLSCSNQLMVANQNAHAFRRNSIVAKMKMSRSQVGAMTTMMFASWHHSVRHRFFLIFCFLASSISSSFLAFHFFGCS